MGRLATMLLLSAPVALFVLTRREENGAGPNVPAGYNPPGGSPPAPTPTPITMTPFLASLPEIPSGASYTQRAAVLAERGARILAEVEKRTDKQSWTGDEVGWVDIWTSSGPRAAKISVMTDALKLDGVRVDVDFLTSQKIADVLGVYLVTPHVLNAAAEQSGIRIEPATHPEWIDSSHPKYDGTGSHTRRMFDHSADVDGRIAKALASGSAGYPGKWKNQGGVEGLVNNAGKHWVNTPRNWEKGLLYGANHGWYRSSGGLWQNVGLAHTLDHVDYSQTFRAMGPTIEVYEGDTFFVLPTAEALTDPKYAPLILGAESAMPLARHPSIPPYGGVA